MRIPFVLGVAVAATVATAEAQVAVGGRVGYLDRRLTVHSAVEHQAGMVGGLDVVLNANVLRLTLHGGGGKLSAETAQTPEVDYGRLSGELAVAPIPWFALCGGVDVSAFVSDIGTQRWILPRLGVELRPGFANIPAETYVRGMAIVGASTNSPDASSGGLAVGGGLLIGRSKLQFFVDYELQRLNFDAAVGREEQRGEISAGARFRF